jgi:N6-L-threonylcarbamoyladenine synthase
MNFINNETAKDADFIEKNKADICASLQFTIIDILMDKLKKASKETGIKEIAIAGGVSANSGLRNTLQELEKELGWKVHIPKFEFCTDNAAIIAITGYYKFINQEFADQSVTPKPRYEIQS